MLKNSLQDIRSLPDPLLGFNFTMLIPNIPGGGDSRAMALKCMQSVIPGQQLEAVLVALSGYEVKFAGRVVYSHTLPVVFLETRDMSTRDALKQWQDMARDVKNNTGNYKTAYATDVKLQLFDDTGSVVRTVNVYGVYPEDVSDVQLDGSSSAAVSVSATFSYDYWQDA